jgi:two-component system sensor histidine kinase/response regulator
MPKRDGIDFLRELDEANDQSGISILMLSRADQRLFRKRIAGLHVSAFLEKPVSQSGLLNSITEAFEGAAAARERELPVQKTSQTLKVLIAEDIPANQKVVTAILSRRGHEPTIANNGREAIDLFERQDFDAILMDVQMPILDGIQATQAIRDIEKNSGRRIPIIAMTAHAMPGDREGCMAAGMDYYLSKPLDAQLLLKTIEHLKQPRVASNELLNSFITKSGFWRLKQDKPGARSLSAKGEARVTEKTKPLELWKPEVALRRMGDDTELLSSMVDYFLEDSLKLLAELRQLIEDDNSAEAARAAHSLKGLCSNFEAVQATQAALEVETTCMAGKLAEAEKLLPALSETFANLSLELTAWQNQQVNAGSP